MVYDYLKIGARVRVTVSVTARFWVKIRNLGANNVRMIPNWVQITPSLVVIDMNLTEIVRLFFLSLFSFFISRRNTDRHTSLSTPCGSDLNKLLRKKFRFGSFEKKNHCEKI